MKKLLLSFLLLLTCSAQQVITTGGGSGGVKLQEKPVSGTAISSCQAISSPGNYYLTQDLSAANSCISINAAGVFLDLRGHTITYATNPTTFSVTAEAVVRSTTKDGNGNGLDTLSRGGKGSHIRVVGISRISNTIGGAADYTVKTHYNTDTTMVGCGWAATQVTWCGSQGPTTQITTPNLLTVTVANNFVPGQVVSFLGMVNSAFLNSQSVTVLSANATSFTANFTHANYTAIGDGEGTVVPGPPIGNTYYVDYTYQEPQCGICSVASFDSSTAGITSWIRVTAGVQNMTICCGRVTAGSGAPPYSAGLMLGQQNGLGTGTNSIKNMVIDQYGISSTGINGNSMDNFVVENLTINQNSTALYNRSAEEATGLMSVNQNSGTGNDFGFINLIGSPQSGLRSDTTRSKMHDSTISLTTVSTNGAAVFLYGNFIEAYKNTVHCETGSFHCRGIIAQADGSHGTSYLIHDNVVHARDNNQNYEYGTRVPGATGTPGCELFGAYGIQLDSTSGAQVYNNTSTAYADVCPGRAFRMTTTPIGGGNVSHDNVYSGVRQGTTTQKAIGISLNADAGLTSTNDTFIGDSYPVMVDIDGAFGDVLNNCTITKGTNPDGGYFTIYIDHQPNVDLTSSGGYNFKTYGSLYIRDCTFTNGASPTDYRIKPLVSGGTGVPFDLFMQWTYSPTYTSGGNPLVGATVTITDGLSAAVYTGTTDAAGKIPGQVLNQFRAHNTSASQTQENQTPHDISVSKLGCSTLSYSINITATLTESRAVSCP